MEYCAVIFTPALLTASMRISSDWNHSLAFSENMQEEGRVREEKSRGKEAWRYV